MKKNDFSFNIFRTIQFKLTDKGFLIGHLSVVYMNINAQWIEYLLVLSIAAMLVIVSVDCN